MLTDTRISLTKLAARSSTWRYPRPPPRNDDQARLAYPAGRNRYSPLFMSPPHRQRRLPWRLSVHFGNLAFSPSIQGQRQIGRNMSSPSVFQIEEHILPGRTSWIVAQRPVFPWTQIEKTYWNYPISHSILKNHSKIYGVAQAGRVPRIQRVSPIEIPIRELHRFPP